MAHNASATFDPGVHAGDKGLLPTTYTIMTPPLENLIKNPLTW